MCAHAICHVGSRHRPYTAFAMAVDNDPSKIVCGESTDAKDNGLLGIQTAVAA